VDFVGTDHVTDLEDQDGRRARRTRKQPQVNPAGLTEASSVEQSQMKYDSTGMYHWCPSRNIDECLMDRQEAAMTVLQVS
jgi:hypothetical protein